VAKEKPIIEQIKERFTSDRHVLNWKPQGQHKRGRPLRRLGGEQ
jgi:hypothetical protein